MGEPSILLITPPFTQLNTPYPATCYLTGFLRGQGYRVEQVDLSLETALHLFCRQGLSLLFDQIESTGPHGEQVQVFLRRRNRYQDTIDATIHFLQGQDSTLAHRIAARTLLPEGPRFDSLPEDLSLTFGDLGITDLARHLATLYLDDLTDLIRSTVDPHFGLNRYAPSLATAATSFEPLAERLATPPGLIDALLVEALKPHINRIRPQVVGLTVPFPGNLYGALRTGAWLRRHHPEIVVVMGGGYVNTELRHLAEPRLFDFVHYVTLDDGERPFLCLLEHLQGRRLRRELCRTWVSDGGEVKLIDGAQVPDVEHTDTGTPTYDGLPLRKYLSVLEVLNPMIRLWNDGRWNKLTLAHGCYWKRCSFCDVHLDYIGRYDPAPARVLVDRMEKLVSETGTTGFHFVDEAAPPGLLKEVALEILSRGLSVSWWGNIRFERRFDLDLCRLLASSGAVAVSGGLEVASDRLLSLMQKGVTVEQVAKVAQAFTRAGVLVHAYLMYGFPTMTTQETVDSLERVRQLFEAGVLHSGFWHRFTATAHSPVGRDPARYGVEITGPTPGKFAWNDLEYSDPVSTPHDNLGPHLDRALFNYMNGSGLDLPAHQWFTPAVDASEVPKDLITTFLATQAPSDAGRLSQRMVWLGEPPVPGEVTRGRSRSRKVESTLLQTLDLSGSWGSTTLELAPHQATGLSRVLLTLTPRGNDPTRLPTLEDILPQLCEIWGKPPEVVLTSRVWIQLRELGLVLI